MSRLLRGLSLRETVRKLITPLVSVLRGKFRKQKEFCLITKYASETVGEENWNNIQWNEVKKTVRLLQERIVKAKQRKRICNAVLSNTIDNI